MATVIATGKEVWQKLKTIPPEALFDCVADTGGGQQQVIKPMTAYTDFVYITNSGSEAYYVQDDALKAEKPSVLFRNATVSAMAKAGASAKPFVDAYKVMMAFATSAIPGGRVIGAGVTAISIAVFYSKYQNRLDTVIDDTKAMAKLLLKVYGKSPKLVTAVLCVTAEETTGKLQETVKKKGLVGFVLGNLDWQQFAKDVASLLGDAFRLMTRTGSFKGKLITGFFVKTGMARLGLFVTKLMRIRSVLKLVHSGTKLRPRPGPKEKVALVNELISAFGEAGVKISAQQAQEIADEDYLYDPALTEDLKQLKDYCDRLTEHLGFLAKAADDELF